MVNCRFLKPYDRAVFEEMVRSHPLVVTVEEGQIPNGFGAYMAREIAALELDRAPAVSTLGIPDEFIEHGKVEILHKLHGLTAEAALKKILAHLK